MPRMSSFAWCDPGSLQDRDLQLLLKERAPADPSRGYVPAYKFEMRRTGRTEHVGGIDLRIGRVRRLSLYGGHLGYAVERAFQGHRYAARACRLLLPLARHHGLTEIWITCNPENIASRRTAELAGGTFIEIVDLPEDHEMYLKGDRRKCRYRIEL